MPILKRETDIFPSDLLRDEEPALRDSTRWWVLYTRARREKDLVRRLLKMQLAFYCPIIERQHRSPNGRLRTSFLPLFASYVFLRGDEDSRYAALTTGCISRVIDVPDPHQFVQDLRQVHRLIQTGAQVTPESRLEPGARVRVKTGILAGLIGTVIERRGQRRLLVAVDFLQQGASVELLACDLDAIDA